MATIMKSLKRHPTVRWELWEVVFRTIGITACIIVPGVDLVRSHYFQQGSSPVDPWQYGLLGLGALLVVIYERLKLIAQLLGDLRDMVYLVLKDPDDDERQISVATFRHVRRRLGLPDSES
jgi:hypothetical protein